MSSDDLPAAGLDKEQPLNQSVRKDGIGAGPPLIESLQISAEPLRTDSTTEPARQTRGRESDDEWEEDREQTRVNLTYFYTAFCTVLTIGIEHGEDGS